MKQNVFKIFFLGLILGLCFQSNAQNYGAAVGLRGGSLNGLTYKQFLGSENAFEGLVSSRWKGMQVTGLYEVHAMAFDVPQLQWYYGAGAHVGFFDGYDDHPFFDDEDKNESFVLMGVDAIVGIEYTIEEIPVVIGLDWKPEFNILGHSGFWFGDTSLSIRYYW